MQSAKLDGSNINCTFAKGSNAIGCKTVLTCNISVAGSTEVFNTSRQIMREKPTQNYATGTIISGQKSNCLTYDLFVYDIVLNYSAGFTPAKTITNFTIVFESSSPAILTSTPIPSPSSNITERIWKGNFLLAYAKYFNYFNICMYIHKKCSLLYL